MNGFIPKTVAGLALAAGFGLGCANYRQCVDPCWPQRWNEMARSSVRETFNAQAMNGHILDQTVWDYYFAADKEGKVGDTLNEAGRARLDYMARRRPVPDLHVYLQTAQNVPYAGNAPERTIAARQEIDQKRIQAVQAYLSTRLSPAGINTPVEVTVFDPAAAGMAALGPGGSLQPGRDLPIIGGWNQLSSNFQGQMQVSGFSTAAGAASTGGSGGGTGGGAAGR
jgi:hypothetical protein